MFPSHNFDNHFESLLKLRSPSSSSSLIQNPNPSLLFNFPSPFLDEHESPLNQIFFQNPSADHGHNPAKRPNLGKSKMEDTGKNPSAAVAPPPRRRREGKKDRHSKICTAQGIRDRRMRLSLHVARKFFDLQDMLGYDKASKTIEWLFTQSKKAIKELVDDYQTSPPPNSDVKSESFISECEDRMSGIEEINSNVEIYPFTGDPVKTLKTSTIRPNVRESREKARARARNRTREKMMEKRLQFSDDCAKPNPNHHHNILPFEGVNEDEIRVSPCSGQLSDDVGMIEKFLVNSSSSTSCLVADQYGGGGTAVSDYGDPSSSGGGGGLMGFMGNWDVLSNERSNCFQYSVTNQVTFAGNFNSVYSATAEFP